MEGGNVVRINKLPWRYVKQLHDYWIDEPPIHILALRVSRAFGLRSGKSKPELNDFERQIADWAEQPSSVSAGLKTMGQLPASVAEWITEVARSKDASN